MKKNYLTPTTRVHQMKSRTRLMAGSVTETPGSAEGMSSGSFGSRGYDFDDEEDY